MTDNGLYETMRSAFVDCCGIPVALLGEDGDTFVALGHHSPRQALDAFNAEARGLGWMDLLDGDHEFADDAEDDNAWLDRLTDRAERRWATVQDVCDDAADADHDPGCSACSEIREAGWWMVCEKDQNAAGAFPVTVFHL